MADKKKPTPKKKQPAGAVFDVAKPGKGGITTSSTSRPVIIKHPHMPDPMVNQERRDDLQPAPVLQPTKKIVIKPLHDDIDNDGVVDAEPIKVSTAAPTEPKSAPLLAADAAEAEALIPEADSADDTVTEPESVEQTAEPPAEPEPAAPKPPVKSAEPADDAPAITPDTKIADVVPEPDTSGIPEDPEEREADTKAARERAARLQRMIDEEEYFLPIETLEERRSRKVAIIGLLFIIILAAAWYDVALDSNLLPNQFNLPHTSFFSVK